MELSLMGERIKHIRAEQKLTLEKLSERVGISRNFLWEIEDGRKAPALSTLCGICRELNVSADYLLGFSPVCGRAESDGGQTMRKICEIIDTLDENEKTMLHELLITYKSIVK